MLLNLLTKVDNKLFEHHVISLTNYGPIAERIESLGVKVTALKIKGPISLLRGAFRLYLIMKQVRPNITQTWMYHSDLIGGLVAKIFTNSKIIWGIHHTNLVPTENKKTTILAAHINAKLSSHIPDKIVCCSRAALDVHYGIGFDCDKTLYIPNGFDINRYGPSVEAKTSFRADLGLGDDVIVAGMVGRFDPQKDHHNLIKAAARLKNRSIKIVYVLCGKNVDNNNTTLKGWLQEANLTDVFFLLGERRDIPRITAALDISVLPSSHGEAFPLVLGEAMSSCVPCIATNIGDAANIVDETGLVIEPKNPDALADALYEFGKKSNDDREKLGAKARERIIQNFKLENVVKKYEELYLSLSEE